MTAFITLAGTGRLVACDMKIPGKPLHFKRACVMAVALGRSHDRTSAASAVDWHQNRCGSSVVPPEAGGDASLGLASGAACGNWCVYPRSEERRVGKECR